MLSFAISVIETRDQARDCAGQAMPGTDQFNPPSGPISRRLDRAGCGKARAFADHLLMPVIRFTRCRSRAFTLSTPSGRSLLGDETTIADLHHSRTRSGLLQFEIMPPAETMSLAKLFDCEGFTRHFAISLLIDSGSNEF